MPARRSSTHRVLTVTLAFVIAWVFVVASAPADALAASTYYVATNGNDANPGTQAAPWRTIQKAANTLAAGDTVVVQPGAYNERVQVTRSGSAGKAITFRANGSVSMKGFTIKANHIAVAGFYITGAPNDSTNGYGVYVQGSNNIIESNHLYYNVRGGVILTAPVSSPATTSNNIVRNNRLERNTLTGIDVRGRNNLIEGNEIWATIQHHPAWTNPPSWLDADGIRFHGGGHIIRRNFIHDISFSQPENLTPHIDCFQTWADSSHEAAFDIVFEQNFCRVLESHAQNENGQGFMIEGTTRNLTIKNNILLTYLGINVHTSSNLQIENNTFVSSLAFTQWWPRGVRLVSSPGAIVQNNIFADVGATGNAYLEADSASQSGLQAGYNLVWMSDGRTPPGSPRPNDLWNVDPQFVDRANHNYHVRNGSRAVDSGVSLPQVTADFEGHPRPMGGNWDRGAHEIESAVSAAPAGNRVVLSVIVRRTP